MALDNFRRTNITLNRANQPVLEPQITKVGDVNGRELVVQIVDGDVIKDQTGLVLKLNWQHANGNQGSETFSTLDAKQGVFSVFYPENMLYRGTVKANISINEKGKITNSLNFQIAVKGDVFDGSAVEVDGALFTLKDLKNKIDTRNSAIESLGNRQNSIESQFSTLQQELTDKDVISAPEVIAARSTNEGISHSTLSERLDDEQEKLAEKAEYANSYSGIYANRKLQPVISIIDDDGRPQFLNTYYPSVQKLKYPVTVAVITGRVDTKPESMTEEDIRMLSDTGYFEFVSHTKSHIPSENHTLETWEEEMRDSKNWLYDRGYNSNVLVYPGGYSTPDLRRIAAKYYNTAVDIDRGAQINRPPLITYNLKRVYIDSGVDLVKAKIDEIVKNGGWLIIGSHCFYPNFNIKDIEEVVNYARSKSVPIENIQNALKYYGNLIEAGDAANAVADGFVLDAEGTLHGPQINFRIINDNIKSTDTYKSFPPYAFSTKWFGTSKAQESGMPQNLAGILITDRTGTVSSFINQTYMVYKSNRVFKRWWNNNGTWDAWKEMTSPTFDDIDDRNPVRYLDRDAVTGQTPYSDFSAGKITYAKIGYGATDFPDIRGGLLTTNRAMSVDYTFQTYEVSKSNNIYRRYWDTAQNDWSAWDKYAFAPN